MATMNEQKHITDEVVEIPQPPGLPFLGNITSIDQEFPLGSWTSLADQFGEIYRLQLPGKPIVVVSSHALVHETCDEKRFRKSINSTLMEVRNGVHDGLFTAKPGEENWGIAHRILMPAFGPLSIQGMFDEMHDVAAQLALKWARYGPDSPIPVTDDFTRLALDTLALCSMGYRFNSYYSPTLHPFIQAMGDFLTESGSRSRRLPLPSIFFRAQDQKFEADIEVLRSTAQGVLDSRKTGESDRNDLLAAMLRGVDSKTGKKMTDESIMDNLITFLIAGHETTSGLLSFTFYQLLKHPETYRKAQQEVDDVVGRGVITVEHLSKLPYINAVLRETLRLNAPIPLFTVEAIEDTLLAGKYPVKAGETIVNLLAKSHIDPEVFGGDANEFNPERMLDQPFERIMQRFPNAWKPFGNGMRACIGRPFAWQESLLVMAMLLQNFNFVLEPSYSLGIKQTLTIKPKDMCMRAVLRHGLSPTTLERQLSGQATSKTDSTDSTAHDSNDKEGVPLTILYGSSSGTCQTLAQRAAGDARDHGFRVVNIDCLDRANGALPTDHPVVIVTTSYEGQPPDNAGHFQAWIESLKKEEQPLKGVSYAVFGCGHKDWTQTFHRIPRRVDEILENVGAKRVAKLGLSDVSQGSVFSDFEAWEESILWPALTSSYKVEKDEARQSKGGLSVKVSTPRVLTLQQDVVEAVVVDACALTSTAGDRVKKHLEIRLPADTTYATGDYLAVLPINPKESIERAMRCFHLPWDAYIEITGDGSTTLPINKSLPAVDILSSYVELSQPATKRDLLRLAESAKYEETKASFHRLASSSYADEIISKRVSVLDVLERHQSIDLPIEIFLSMLPPMRARQYSISSSSMWNPNHATLTFSVLTEPSYSGQGRFNGVASSYLASLSKGDAIHVAVKPSPAAFRLPLDQEQTPIICIAAGTGIAPFRGFFQERAMMLAAGRILAPAIFFFGCRSPEEDLYHEQMDEWQRSGAVDVRRAFSRAPDSSEGCRYVQERIWKDRDDFIALWRKGARVFVCGSQAIAESAKQSIIKIKTEMVREEGGDTDVGSIQSWFESLRNVRYVADVFD